MLLLLREVTCSPDGSFSWYSHTLLRAQRTAEGEGKGFKDLTTLLVKKYDLSEFPLSTEKKLWNDVSLFKIFCRELIALTGACLSLANFFSFSPFFGIYLCLKVF